MIHFYVSVFLGVLARGFMFGVITCTLVAICVTACVCVVEEGQRQLIWVKRLAQERSRMGLAMPTSLHWDKEDDGQP